MTNIRRKEQGSALIIAMLITIFLMGLVAVALVMVNNQSTDSTQKEEIAKSLDAAEAGYNQFLKEARVKADYNAETGEFSATFGQPKTGDTSGEYRVLAGELDGLKYSVETRSAFEAWKNFRAGTTTVEPTGLPEVTSATRNSLSNATFDVLNVMAETRKTGDTGENAFVRKIQATVELSKEPIKIPAALYLEEGEQNLEGNDYRISGEDHEKDPKAVYPAYCLKMPYDGRLKAVFVESSAALDSGFWMVDPATGSDTCLIPSNHPATVAARTSYTTEFAEGQELVFFARIQGYNYGLSTYDHYFVGHIDPWDNIAYGCISLYKLKSTVSLTGKTAAQVETILSTNSNYELIKDASGKDYYKRLDIKASDMANPNIRRVTYGIEDLKGKPGRYYQVDWDHNDIVCDVYIMPTVSQSGATSSLTYSVVRDSTNSVKFENAPTCLGENGVIQTDQYVITTSAVASKVSVTTKAGTKVALNTIGDVVTDSNGFTIRLLLREGTTYTFGCTSDSSTRTAALSHILFTFTGATVATPSAGSYTCTRTSGSVEYISTGDPTLYSLSSRPNEYDYLTNRYEYALPAVTYEGNYSDFGFSTYNAGVLVTANNATEKITDANAVSKGSVDVDAVAKAYLASTGMSVTTVTSLVTGECGDSENYKLVHVTGDLNVPSTANVTGGGVLIVDGNMTVDGMLDWTGIVICRGNMTLDTTMSGKYIFVRGSVLVKGTVTINGKVDIWYSYDAVQKTLTDLVPELMIVPNPRAWREVN